MIKSIPKTHLKKIQSELSKAVIFACHHQGKYSLSSEAALLTAIKNNKSTKVTTRANAQGIYQLDARVSDTLVYRAFVDRDKAKKTLPERFHDALKERNTVDQIEIVTASGNFALTPDEVYSLRQFEAACFQSALNGGSEVEVYVTFSNGREEFFELEVGFASDECSERCLGLAQHIERLIEEACTPEGLEAYEEEGQLDNYYFLVGFKEKYELKGTK